MKVLKINDKELSLFKATWLHHNWDSVDVETIEDWLGIQRRVYRVTPQTSPCALTFLVEGDDIQERDKNVSNLTKELVKCTIDFEGDIHFEGTLEGGETEHINALNKEVSYSLRGIYYHTRTALSLTGYSNVLMIKCYGSVDGTLETNPGTFLQTFDLNECVFPPLNCFGYQDAELKKFAVNVPARTVCVKLGEQGNAIHLSFKDYSGHYQECWVNRSNVYDNVYGYIRFEDNNFPAFRSTPDLAASTVTLSPTVNTIYACTDFNSGPFKPLKRGSTVEDDKAFFIPFTMDGNTVYYIDSRDTQWKEKVDFRPAVTPKVTPMSITYDVDYANPIGFDIIEFDKIYSPFTTTRRQYLKPEWTYAGHAKDNLVWISAYEEFQGYVDTVNQTMIERTPFEVPGNGDVPLYVSMNMLITATNKRVRLRIFDANQESICSYYLLDDLFVKGSRVELTIDGENGLCVVSIDGHTPISAIEGLETFNFKFPQITSGSHKLYAIVDGGDTATVKLGARGRWL